MVSAAYAAEGVPLPGVAFNRCNRLILLAVALIGMAHVAFLPPFEGFDEPAHLSYIQQIADTGRIPQFGIDKVSSDIEGYTGPRPYTTRIPPFDQNGGFTYKSFFAQPLPALPDSVTRAYGPGEHQNYETQHPPLYYLLLTPGYLLAKDWSWQGLFLQLRSLSWAMAFAGFLIGCSATQRALLARGIGGGPVLAAAAWPLLFPEFFPEMARLGNDSLCLLFAGISWALLLALLSRPRAAVALTLGLVLGLGLLTKAFFLPITAGVCAVLCYDARRGRDRRQYLNAACVLLIAALFGGGWYAYKLVSVGSVVGASDLIYASQHGSLWMRLMETFTIAHFLVGIAGTFVSFAWAGTWSLARLHDVLTLPVVALFLLPIFDWLRGLVQSRDSVTVAPVFLAGAMFAGMVYYLLNQITLVPPGPGAPGWYFHILAGPLSLALVLGWRWRKFLIGLVIYALLFHALDWLTQLSLFSGCAFMAGSYRYIQFDLADCVIEPARLSVLAEPLLGAACLVAAIIAGGLAVKNWPGRHGLGVGA